MLLQVKGADGRWEDVPLAPGEMAVMLGHTASRATAGLLQPAVYRVVRPMRLTLKLARASLLMSASNSSTDPSAFLAPLKLK